MIVYTYVYIWLYRLEYMKSITSVTISPELLIKAKEFKINVSGLLEEALINKLEVDKEEIEKEKAERDRREALVQKYRDEVIKKRDEI